MIAAFDGEILVCADGNCVSVHRIQRRFQSKVHSVFYNFIIFKIIPLVGRRQSRLRKFRLSFFVLFILFYYCLVCFLQMERSPVIGTLFHIRVQSLLLTLAGLDIFFIFHAYQTTVTKGASVQLVYGFEYCILIIMIANIFIKVFSKCFVLILNLNDFFYDCFIFSTSYMR